MPDYIVSAAVNSAPDNISLQVNTVDVPMTRDPSGAWAGKKQVTLPAPLPDSVPVQLIATGIAFAPWTLKVSVATLPPAATPVGKSYTNQGQIPQDGLLNCQGAVSLKAAAGAGTP